MHSIKRANRMRAAGDVTPHVSGEHIDERTSRMREGA